MKAATMAVSRVALLASWMGARRAEQTVPQSVARTAGLSAQQMAVWMVERMGAQKGHNSVARKAGWRDADWVVNSVAQTAPLLVLWTAG